MLTKLMIRELKSTGSNFNDREQQRMNETRFALSTLKQVGRGSEKRHKWHMKQNKAKIKKNLKKLAEEILLCICVCTCNYGIICIYVIARGGHAGLFNGRYTPTDLHSNS